MECNECRKVKKVTEFGKAVFDKRRGKAYIPTKCKECKYEYTRKWKKNNRDKCNSSDKVWRSKNTDKYNESQRKTYHKYIDRRREKLKEYYYVLKNRFGVSPNTVYRNGGPAVVIKLLKNAVCSDCNTTENIVIHHKDNHGRHNLNKGLNANNNITNLEILCRSCHTAQHQRERKYGTNTRKG